MTGTTKVNKLKTLIINTLIIVLGTLTFYRAPNDPDFGWHYRYGQYIVEHKDILRENTFSFTYPNYKWANSYWISEVILYLLYTYTGPLIMGLTLSFIFSLLVFILIDIEYKNTKNKAFIFFLLIILLNFYMISDRPMFFSTMFLFLETYILCFRKKWIKYFPILFVVWANTHADFVLGLFIFGIYSGYQYLNEVMLSKPVNLFKPLTKFIVLVISILVTLINPFGIQLWATLLKELFSSQFEYITEWLPYLAKVEKEPINYFLLSLPVFAYFHAIYKKANEKNGWLAIAATIFMILAIKAIYFFRIFFILGIFFVLDYLKDINNLIRINLSPFTKENKIFKYFVCVYVFLFISTFTLVIGNEFVKNVELSSSLEKWSVKGEYPYEAVQFLKKNPLKGNMMNAYNWGGYLIWQLPEYKTFVDGRMASWRGEDNQNFIKKFTILTTNPEKNLKVLDSIVQKYQIGFILFPSNTTFSKFLENQQSNKWKVVFKDKDSEIFQKLEQ